MREGTPVFKDLSQIKALMEPGDLIATKTNPNTWKKTNLIDYASVKAVELLGGSPWSHIAVYKGDGNTIHTSPKNHSVPKVEDDTLDSMVGAGRDVLVLRPKELSSEERAHSVKRMEDLLGTGYSYKDIASVFLPSIANRENEYTKKPSGATCTHTAAWATPGLKFDRPIASLAPKHFLAHDKLDHVAAYLEDKIARLKENTKLASEILMNHEQKTAFIRKTLAGIGDYARNVSLLGRGGANPYAQALESVNTDYARRLLGRKYNLKKMNQYEIDDSVRRLMAGESWKDVAPEAARRNAFSRSIRGMWHHLNELVNPLTMMIGNKKSRTQALYDMHEGGLFGRGSTFRKALSFGGEDTVGNMQNIVGEGLNWKTAPRLLGEAGKAGVSLAKNSAKPLIVGGAAFPLVNAYNRMTIKDYAPESVPKGLAHDFGYFAGSTIGAPFGAVGSSIGATAGKHIGRFAGDIADAVLGTAKQAAFEKIAKPKWMKLMEQGLLSPEDVSRLARSGDVSADSLTDLVNRSRGKGSLAARRGFSPQQIAEKSEDLGMRFVPRSVDEDFAGVTAALNRVAESSPARGAADVKAWNPLFKGDLSGASLTNSKNLSELQPIENADALRSARHRMQSYRIPEEEVIRRAERHRISDDKNFGLDYMSPGKGWVPEAQDKAMDYIHNTLGAPKHTTIQDLVNEINAPGSMMVKGNKVIVDAPPTDNILQNQYTILHNPGNPVSSSALSSVNTPAGDLLYKPAIGIGHTMPDGSLAPRSVADYLRLHEIGEAASIRNSRVHPEWKNNRDGVSLRSVGEEPKQLGSHFGSVPLAADHLAALRDEKAELAARTIRSFTNEGFQKSMLNQHGYVNPFQAEKGMYMSPAQDYNLTKQIQKEYSERSKDLLSSPFLSGEYLGETAAGAENMIRRNYTIPNSADDSLRKIPMIGGDRSQRTHAKAMTKYIPGNELVEDAHFQIPRNAPEPSMPTPKPPGPQKPHGKPRKPYTEFLSDTPTTKAALKNQMEHDEWIARVNGQDMGPFSREELKRMYASGEIDEGSKLLDSQNFKRYTPNDFEDFRDIPRTPKAPQAPELPKAPPAQEPPSSSLTPAQKAMLGIGAGTAVAGTGAYLYNKLKNKPENS